MITSKCIELMGDNRFSASLASIAMAVLILGMNAADARLTVMPEANSKFVINQSYYDPELQRSVGLVVSRIIIENETDHSIQGYIADSAGTRLDVVEDGIQVVMVKYVFNNTASTKWRMQGWIDDGRFEIEKLKDDNNSIEAMRIYVGPIDYVIEEESVSAHSRPIVFINPAWAEFRYSTPSGAEGSASRHQAVAGSDPSFASQNPYDPAMYEPKHCSYLSDLTDAYMHCTKLYIINVEDDEEPDVAQIESNSEKRGLRLLDQEPKSLATDDGLRVIRVGNITLTDVADITIEGNVFGGANFTYPAISANDTILGNILDSVSCSPSSGTFFAVNNTTIVSCSVSNNVNETATDTFNVTVTDSTAPLIANLTRNLVVEGNVTGGAIVAYQSPSATDIVDSSVETHCLPASGSFFALGSTLVSCVAFDDTMNSATEIFNVTVTDTTAPEIHLPSEKLSYKTADQNGKRVHFVVNASDAVDPEPSISCLDASGKQFEAGQIFPVGTTTLTCQAFDHSGNVSEKEELLIRIRLVD